jgi:formylmethanofuran dehydrogenase subunit E
MPPMTRLGDLLAASAALHQHLCPRQVLGVRMGLLAGQLLDVDVPRTDKRLLTIVETDGCAADGVAVATGCRVGRRTLRVEDYGKVAATVVDTLTERAIRVLPSRMSRTLAAAYAPGITDRWQVQLVGYQRMPDDLLMAWHEVELVQPLAAILSSPGARSTCAWCGEEILNEREVMRAGERVCRTCAGDSYYRSVRCAAELMPSSSRVT